MDWSKLFGSLSHTDVVAYIGAFTGTAALLWNIYAARTNNRVSLNVKIHEDHRIGALGETRYWIVASISNVGKMPTSIHEVSLDVHTIKYRMYYAQFDTTSWFENFSVPTPHRLDSGATYVVETEVTEDVFQIFPDSSRYFVAVTHSGARKPLLTPYKRTFFKEKTN